MKADGKEVKKYQLKYFPEYSDMYKFLQENKQYKMLDYSFTFAYGYCLKYTEK